MALLSPYISDPRVWRCPADPNPRAFVCHAINRGGDMIFSNGASYMFSEQTYTHGTNIRLRQADLFQPEKFGYFSDGNSNLNAFQWWPLRGVSIPTQDNRLTWEHNGGVNILLGDFHVEWFPFYSRSFTPGQINNIVRSDPLQ